MELAQILDAGDVLHGRSRPLLVFIALTGHLAWLGHPPNRSAERGSNQEGSHDPTTLRARERQKRRETPPGGGLGGGAGRDLSGFGPGQCHPASAVERRSSRQAQGLTSCALGSGFRHNVCVNNILAANRRIDRGNDSSYFLKPFWR